MPSGLPGKAWDLVVDVHNGHPERCGGGQVPAVSHSHEKTEAVRGTFQVQETGLLTQPQRKRKQWKEQVERAPSPASCFLGTFKGYWGAFPLWPWGSLPHSSVWSQSQPSHILHITMSLQWTCSTLQELRLTFYSFIQGAGYGRQGLPTLDEPSTTEPHPILHNHSTSLGWSRAGSFPWLSQGLWLPSQSLTSLVILSDFRWSRCCPSHPAPPVLGMRSPTPWFGAC